MTPKQSHTPTPWKGLGNAIIADNKHETLIAEVFDENEAWKANKDYILRAVNSHEELLEACKIALEYREQTHWGDDECRNILIAAISRAEEK